MTTTTTETKDLHIRSIPSDLRMKIKLAATRSNLTIKDWVIEAIKTKMEAQGED